MDSQLKDAVRRVASRHGLDADWLNDHAAAWHPRTLDLGECDRLLEHQQLLVLGAPLQYVFLMKLNRSEPPDVADIMKLWPHVLRHFPTAARAVSAYYDAFPHERRDPHLAEHVVDLARRAGITLPLT